MFFIYRDVGCMEKCWINLPVLDPREILWKKNGENCGKIIEKKIKTPDNSNSYRPGAVSRARRIEK